MTEKQDGLPEPGLYLRASWVMPWLLVVAAALCLGPMAGLFAGGQILNRGDKEWKDPFTGFPTMDPALQRRLLREQNVARQKAIVDDTRELLRLASELHRDVAEREPEGLTPEEMAKVVRIEKLAHNVEEKMRFTPGPGPTFNSPFASPFQ